MCKLLAITGLDKRTKNLIKEHLVGRISICYARDCTVRTSLRSAACDFGLDNTVTVVEEDESAAIECDMGRMRAAERCKCDDVDGRPTLSVFVENDTRVTPLKQKCTFIITKLCILYYWSGNKTMHG